MEDALAADESGGEARFVQQVRPDEGQPLRRPIQRSQVRVLCIII